MLLAEWFLVQTTDLKRRQLSRSLAGACPGTWWARQFGCSALLPPPPAVAKKGELFVYPVNIREDLLDAMLWIMHRPDRVVDAARTIPKALRFADVTLRQWRDALDEFGFETGGRDAADEEDSETGEPPAKRQRVLTPYDQRLVELGEALGDYVLANGPDAKAFVEGFYADIEVTMCDHRTDPSLSFDIPRHEGNSTALRILDELPFVRFYTHLDEACREHVLNGLLHKFPPGAEAEDECILDYDPTSQEQSGQLFSKWPLVGLTVHPRDASIWKLSVFYTSEDDE